MEEIIYTCLRASVRLHNALHGFRAGRRTETVILDLKMVQELKSMDQEPLFLVFLDLRKVYYTIYCGCLLTTLEGYGAGPHMCRLLAIFWEQQKAITCQNRYHSLDSKATKGTTQSGIISPTLFSLIVNNMVGN